MNPKKTFFKSIFSLFLLVAVVIACSDDTAMHELNNENNTNTTQAEFEARGSYWDGIIAYDRGNGNYEFAVDPQLLMDDMEDSLADKGITTTLLSLTIVEKTATNDPNNHGHMLIGTDHAGVSIGYILELENSAFRIGKSLGSGTDKGISCKGCTDGCNIMYFTHADGTKSPYCNENGCSTYDCKEIK